MADGKGTIVLPCSCKDEEQDQMYGQGMRLHNKDTKNPKNKKAYCTVCSPSQARTLKHIPADAPNEGMMKMLGIKPGSIRMKGNKPDRPERGGKSY